MQHLQKTRGTSFKPKAFLFLFPGALFNSSRCLRASVAAAPPPIFRTLFQVPYPATPLFAAHTKTPGGVGVFFPFRHSSLAPQHSSLATVPNSFTKTPAVGRNPHSLLHYLLLPYLVAPSSHQSRISSHQSLYHSTP